MSTPLPSTTSPNRKAQRLLCPLTRLRLLSLSRYSAWTFLNVSPLRPTTMQQPPVAAEVDQNSPSDRHWHPTTATEMKAFVALNIVMGVKNLPEYADCWSTEPILHDAFVAAIMPRRRYEKLCQFMHCSIAADEDRADKLTKVRPLITLCQQNF